MLRGKDGRIKMVSVCLLPWLQGVGVESSRIMQDKDFLQVVLDDGLVVMTWGQANNDKKVVEAQRAAGIHAIIHDR